MKRILSVFLRADRIVLIAVAFAGLGAFATRHVAPPTEQIVSIPLIDPVVVTAQVSVLPPPTDHEIVLAQLVAEHRCLSEALYYEARGEGVEGQEAVAEVVFNRLRDRAYPHSICGIVHQGSSQHNCQFSFACDGDLDRPKTAADWAQAEMIAAHILTGELRIGSLTGDALYFHPASGQPQWSSGLERTIQIGNHVFFRDAPKSRAS